MMFLHRQVGYLLLVLVLGLLSLGLIMLFSASGKFAAEGDVSMYGMVQKQAMWLMLGLIAGVLVSRMDYHWFTQRAWIWLGIGALLLLCCVVPGLGRRVNGASRWISLGGFTMQPSELMKLAVIVFLAFWLGKQQRRITHLKEGLLIPLAVVGCAMGLVMLGSDLGTCAALITVTTIMLFCAGVQKRWLFPLPFLGIGGVLLVAATMPERRARLLAFLNTEDHADGKFYQQLQGLIALGSGGTSGLGLGNSRQKMNFLPESTTDFIFPVIGEELGLWVALAVVFAFLLVVLCGGWITLHAPDPTGMLLGTGITTMLGLQALINLGVVTALLPNKGMPLPLISYGGSNLMMCMIALGILFNLQRQAVCETRGDEWMHGFHRSVRV